MGQYIKPVLIGVVAFVIGMIVWNLAQGTGLFNFEGSSNFEGKRAYSVDDQGNIMKVA